MNERSYPAIGMPPRTPPQIPTPADLRALRENGVRELRCGDLVVTFWPQEKTAATTEHAQGAPLFDDQPMSTVAAVPEAPIAADALEYAVNGRHPDPEPFERSEEAP